MVNSTEANIRNGKSNVNGMVEREGIGKQRNNLPEGSSIKISIIFY